VTELETERLILRPFTWEGRGELVHIGDDPGTRGFAWQGPVGRETTVRHLREWTEAYRRGLGQLAMIHKADEKLIGHCGLTQRSEGFILAYALHKDYWCMGLAPEACRAVIEYGFEELGLEEIRTGISVSNRAWRGMAERLGMNLRETSRTETGEEVVCYAISREEFMDRRTRIASGRVAR